MPLASQSLKKPALFRRAPDAAADLEQGDPLGAIARTGVTRRVQNWDVMELPEGCDTHFTPPRLIKTGRASRYQKRTFLTSFRMRFSVQPK